MMDEAVDGEYIWEGIKPSPVRTEYRNKMEFHSEIIQRRTTGTWNA